MGQKFQFHENDYEKTGFLQAKDGLGTLWHLPDTFGRGIMRTIDLRPDLRLIIRDFFPHTAVTLTFNETSLPLIFSFISSGNIYNEIHLGRVEKKFCFGTGRTSFSCFHEVRGSSTYPAGHYIRMVNIWISRNLMNSFLGGGTSDTDHFSRFLQKADGTGASIFLGHGGNPVQLLLQEIRNCPYHGAVGRMFLEGKCMELISHQLGPMFQKEPKLFEPAPMSSIEVEQIQYARDILIKDIQAPPTVATLAKQVGINDHKLRKGFRILFGTTIFEQLRLQRLAQARQLLEQSGLNVAEVACKVGYSDLKHFYQAFKKQYSMTPGACRKKR